MTTNPMTKNQIEEIKTRVAEATPGPWEYKPADMRFMAHVHADVAALIAEIERLAFENEYLKLRAENSNAEARAFEALHDGAVKERDDLRARLGIEHPIARMEREDAERRKDPVFLAAMGLIEVLQGETEVRFKSMAEIADSVGAEREHVIQALGIITRITWRHSDATEWLVKMRDEKGELIFLVSSPLADGEDAEDIARVVGEQWGRWREAKGT